MIMMVVVVVMNMVVGMTIVMMMTDGDNSDDTDAKTADHAEGGLETDTSRTMVFTNTAASCKVLYNVLGLPKVEISFHSVWIGFGLD